MKYILRAAGGSLRTPVLELIGGAQALIAAAVGVLVGPIIQRFAWSRSGVSAAVLFASVSLAVGLLISGALIDRWVVGRGRYLPSDEGIGLAVLTFALAFPAIAFAPKEAPASTKRDSAISTLLGLSLREATQTKSLWLLTAVFLQVPIAVDETFVHIVPLLTERGGSSQFATSAISIAGLGLLFGSVLAGYLLDRFFALGVAIIFFLVPAIGMAVLGTSHDTAFLLFGVSLRGSRVGRSTARHCWRLSRSSAEAASSYRCSGPMYLPQRN